MLTEFGVSTDFYTTVKYLYFEHGLSRTPCLSRSRSSVPAVFTIFKWFKKTPDISNTVISNIPLISKYIYGSKP
jgi:hypothetical protein